MNRSGTVLAPPPKASAATNSLSLNTIQGYICSLVAGKTVLDIGCADNDGFDRTRDTWLHRHIHASAARVLGLDYNRAAVDELNRNGYDVVCADAITVDLGEQFDVIVAGEVIEHIDAPGPFLRNLSRHLKPEGKLVLTTPNPWFLMHVLEAYLMRPERRWNAEHVAWFDAFTLQNLVRRCGFRVDRLRYMTRSRKSLTVLNGMNCPKWFASTIVVVASRG